MFLKNKNIFFKIRRSKVTDYAALRVRIKKLFSYFSTKTYVVGTQKNGLNETFFRAPKTYVKTDR